MSVINTEIRLHKTPTIIEQLENCSHFKNRLKTFLLDHPFYSRNEYLCLKKITELTINYQKKVNKMSVFL